MHLIYFTFVAYLKNKFKDNIKQIAVEKKLKHRKEIKWELFFSLLISKVIDKCLCKIDWCKMKTK